MKYTATSLRTCYRCGETKPLSEYYSTKAHPKNNPHGPAYKSCCKTCCAEQRLIQKEKYPHHWIVAKYKISKEAALDLYIRSMKTCDICGTSWITGSDKLCIDHCHTTGKIRGILCKHCNHVLGHSRDNIEILETSIKYLKERS